MAALVAHHREARASRSPTAGCNGACSGYRAPGAVVQARTGDARGARAQSTAHSLGNIDQLRKLGPVAPLLRTFRRGRAGRVAFRDRPDAATMMYRRLTPARCKPGGAENDERA